MRLMLAFALVASATSLARADRKHVAEADQAAPADDQVIVVNTAPKIGGLGQVDRLHRVLDQRGMLFRLSASLEATLEGKNALIADNELIRDAYASSDYPTALKLIEADEKRILDTPAGDLAPAMSQLAAWRGIIAAVLGQEDEATRQFRAAYRFNPAWSIDKKLASHRVRAMVVKAKREPEEAGTLRIDADPDGATVIVDAAEPRASNDRIKLPVGPHLVQIVAPGRGTHAEVVEIEANKVFKLPITLDAETTVDRAAKLVDETAAVPAGKARLKRARALSKLTGVKRILFVEGGGDNQVTVRLYDVDLKKVSKSLSFDGSDSSAMIASEIKAALDPDNLVDANTVVVRTAERPAESHWYNHWYVWAAAAAVVGGSYLTYEYATREPTSLRGF